MDYRRSSCSAQTDFIIRIIFETASSTSSRSITSHFCLFWAYSKVTPFVTKKNRKKAHLFEGKRPSKKRVFLGKATKQIGKKKRNEDQPRAARST